MNENFAEDTPAPMLRAAIFDATPSTTFGIDSNLPITSQGVI